MDKFNKIVGTNLSADPLRQSGSEAIEAGSIRANHQPVESTDKSVPTKREEAGSVKTDIGSFAENLTTEGIDLKNLPVGTELKVGESVRLRITQIGKECHTKCAIFRKVGDCIMPLEGVFAEVLEGGMVKVGDPLIKL
ncbi:MAG: MOSC domain-containing protein [Planctomycetota bacterium]